MIRSARAAATAATAAIAAVLLGACGAPSTGAASTATDTITVLAASSLTDTFTTLGRQFEATHPNTKIVFSFGSSATLANQIVSGAPADVFAAANDQTMQTVADAGTGEAAQHFASNSLQIAVPPGNPGRIAGLSDFADPAKRIALCAERVPCGSAARALFTAQRITPRPDTLEQDVKAALRKVQLDEVDAALVYRTDARAAAADVDGVEFPESARALNDYPIVALRAAPDAAGAAAFVAYVRSEPAQRVLADAGFQR